MIKAKLFKLIFLFLFVTTIGLSFPQSVHALIYQMGYTNDGFNPTGISIKLGSAIQLSNQTSSELALFSSSISGGDNAFKFNRGSIQPGSTVTITLTSVGRHIFLNSNNRAHAAAVEVVTKTFPISGKRPYASATLSADINPLAIATIAPAEIEKLTEKITSNSPIPTPQSELIKLREVINADDSGVVDESQTSPLQIVVSIFILIGLLLTIFFILLPTSGLMKKFKK